MDFWILEDIVLLLERIWSRQPATRWYNTLEHNTKWYSIKGVGQGKISQSGNDLHSFFWVRITRYIKGEGQSKNIKDGDVSSWGSAKKKAMIFKVWDFLVFNCQFCVHNLSNFVYIPLLLKISVIEITGLCGVTSAFGFYLYSTMQV